MSLKKIIIVIIFLVPFYSHAKFLSINKKVARVKKAPRESATVVFKVIQYTPLEIIKVKDNWVRVRDFQGDIGWIQSSYLSQIPTVIIKEKKANIRNGPGIQYELRWTAHLGYPLKCLRENGGWYKIVDNDDETGWVRSDLVWGSCGE
jgi:SH3-like domain-containing protein